MIDPACSLYNRMAVSCDACMHASLSLGCVAVLSSAVLLHSYLPNVFFLLISWMKSKVKENERAWREDSGVL